MELGMIGLGKMGANMVRRLARAGHHLVAYDRAADVAEGLSEEEKGVSPATSLEEMAAQLTPPRAAWMMVPGTVKSSNQRPPNGRSTGMILSLEFARILRLYVRIRSLRSGGSRRSPTMARSISQRIVSSTGPARW